MVPRALAISCAVWFSVARFDILCFGCCFGYLHPHARRDLLMREFGSFFLASPVIFARIPFILEQNDFFRAASFSVLGCGAGGFR